MKIVMRVKKRYLSYIIVIVHIFIFLTACSIGSENIITGEEIVVVENGPGGGSTYFNVYDKDLNLKYSRSEEHTSELQSRQYLVCRLLLEKKKKTHDHTQRYYVQI